MREERARISIYNYQVYSQVLSFVRPLGCRALSLVYRLCLSPVWLGIDELLLLQTVAKSVGCRCLWRRLSIVFRNHVALRVYPLEGLILDIHARLENWLFNGRPRGANTVQIMH